VSVLNSADVEFNVVGGNMQVNHNSAGGGLNNFSAAHPKRPMSLADRPRSTETTYARE
jgi:hypothetical protein